MRAMSWTITMLAFTATALAVDVACTKQQAIDISKVLVQVEAGACQEAPQLLPPNAVGLVALLCPLVENATQLVPVIISSTAWQSLKAEAAKKGDAGK